MNGNKSIRSAFKLGARVSQAEPAGGVEKLSSYTVLLLFFVLPIIQTWITSRKDEQDHNLQLKKFLVLIRIHPKKSQNEALCFDINLIPTRIQIPFRASINLREISRVSPTITGLEAFDEISIGFLNFIGQCWR